MYLHAVLFSVDLSFRLYIFSSFPLLMGFVGR